MKALPAGHAELAAHLAARLGAHAQCFAVLVGNHYGLIIQALKGEQVLTGAIPAGLNIDGLNHSHFIALSQRFPALLGQVGHLINALYPLLIQPLRHLLPGKCRQANFQRNLLQFIGRFPQ